MKVIKPILEFFKHLLSDSTKVMLQNFIGILAFVLMGVVLISNLYWGKQVTEFIFDAFLWIVLGCLGLGTLLSVFKKGNVDLPEEVKKIEKKEDKPKEKTDEPEI